MLWINREIDFSSQRHSPNSDIIVANTVTSAPPIDPKEGFYLDGYLVKNLDGMDSKTSLEFVKTHRNAGETTKEAYERIRDVGVHNIKPFEPASPSQIQAIMSEFWTNTQRKNFSEIS